MQLGCTKKLQDYLKRDISPADQLADPFFSWSADLLTINRHKTVSVVNDCTRCGFVLYGVAAKTMKNLEQQIMDGIRTMLVADEIAPDLIDRYMEDCGQTITFTKTRDRSTVARMNKFNERVHRMADKFVLGPPIQKHCLRWMSDDVISSHGEYKTTLNLLQRAFADHYGTDKVFQHHTLTLMVNLQLDIPCSRVVEIPAGLTLADLHRIVQHLFYWQGYHLHEFRTPDGMPLDIAFPEYADLAVTGEFDESDCTKIEQCVSLQEAFTQYHTLIYTYDFGDDWQHEITLTEETIDAESKWPRCIAAIGTPPPEDVGGETGFAGVRRILSNPQDEEYEDMKNWADDMGWKPFDLEQVNEALKRWRW